jgi:outer membrane lipopolysaccharide assembly protein LptE/RlpB
MRREMVSSILRRIDAVARAPAAAASEVVEPAETAPAPAP